MLHALRFYGFSYFRWLRSWVSFIIAMAAMAAIWYGCYWLIAKYTPDRNMAYFKIGAWTAIVIGLVMLIFNELIVYLVMGCKRVRRREDCPRLWDAVHKVTPLRAYPVPRIYVVGAGDGMNAFSFGWGLPFFSAVAATEELVDYLSQEELEAVMAHEIGHVLNKDILVSTAMTISVMMMAFTGWLLLRFGSAAGESKGEKKGGAAIAVLVLLLVGCVMYVFGRMFGAILQMFVSRQREYAADAAAARIMGGGRPLVAALMKIERNPSIGSKATGAALGFMCVSDPEPDDLLATHPSVQNRINALIRMGA